MGRSINTTHITTFVKGLFDREPDLLIDASLKARIARSLVTRICREPEAGTLAIEELLSKIAQLQEQNKLLEQATLTDPLTGAYNQRYFERAMNEINPEIRSQRRPTGRHFIVMIDLDGFKRINDCHGHDCGNAALKYVVESLKGMVRKSDDICRIGGDEFIIILKDATQEGAYQKIIQISDEFDTMSFMYEEQEVPVRASLGWTEIDPDAFLKEIMKKIDQYVYEAKKIKGDTRFADMVMPCTEDNISTTHHSS